MGAAELIAFGEVRASKQWDTLRQQLHTRFDQWLDGLEAQLPCTWGLSKHPCATIFLWRQILSSRIP